MILISHGETGRHWDPGNLRPSLQLMVDESSSFSFITVATSTFGMSPGINLARWEGRLGCFWKKHLATGGILWNYEWKRHETSPFILGVSILWWHPRCSSGGLKFEKGTGHDRPHITDAWSCMHAVVCSSHGQFCSPFAPTISPPDKVKGVYQRLTQEDSSFRDDHVDPCCKHMQENTNEVYSCLLLYHVNDEIDVKRLLRQVIVCWCDTWQCKGVKESWRNVMRKDVCTEHVVSCPVVIEKRGNSIHEVAHKIWLTKCYKKHALGSHLSLLAASIKLWTTTLALQLIT